jgi:hypothetical protein
MLPSSRLSRRDFLNGGSQGVSHGNQGHSNILSARLGEDLGLLLVDWSRLCVHHAQEAFEQGVVALAVIARA